MSRVTWADPGTRFYETGVDRTVLYVNNVGVAWSGVKSISENPTGGEPKPYYMDGIKFLNLAGKEEFEATIEALGSPTEFGPCDGRQAINNGLFAHQQPRKAFSLSYRTLVGSDTLGQNAGYKIHLVYNALAAPTTREYTSTGENSDPTAKSWALTTLPPSLTGMKPTAHFVIDSRSTPDGLLQAIEDILYGSDAADPRMPLVSELITLFQSRGPVRRTNLIDNPNFIDTSGTVEVRRNLASNPSYKTTLAAVEMRRNLATNPSCETTSGWLSNNTGAWTMSQDATVKNSGTYSMKSTPSASTIGTSRTLASIYSIGGLSIPVGPSELVTVSVHVAHNASANAEANLYVQFLDSANAVLATQNSNVYVSIGAGTSTFTRVKYIATAAPANTASVRVLCNVQKVVGSNVLANEFVWFDDCLIEKASAMLPYFDGSTPAGQLTHSWTGTANASASIGTGVPPNAACLKGYNRPAWVVVGGATDGTNSVRSYLGTSTTTTLPGNALVLFSNDTPPAAPGDVVIASFRARILNATAPVTLNPRVYAYAVSAISSGTIAPIDLPADGSWVTVTCPAYTMPATTTSARIYATVATSEIPKDNLIIETSNVLIEKAASVLPWFDGNTATAEGLTYSWTATANYNYAIATGNVPRGWTVAAPHSVYALPGGGANLFHPDGTAYSVSHYTDSDVEVGTTYTSAATFENPADGIGPKVCYLAMRTYDAAGNNLVWTESNRTTLNPGESVRISMSVTIAPGEAQLRTYLQANGAGRCKLSQVISNAGMASDYFDGDTPDANGRFYDWTSIANNSRSTLTSWYLN